MVLRKLVAQFSLGILLSIPGIHPAIAGETYYIWSEFEQENIQVFLGLERDSENEKIVKLSSIGVNISPTMIVAGDMIWSAWVNRFDGEKYVLKFSTFNRSAPSNTENGFITTSDKTVFSPILSQGRGGKIWIVWSGFDGEDEEIRIAYWKQGRWSQEIPLTDNHLPDTLPSIEVLNNGKMSIIWEQLNDEGFVRKKVNISEEYLSGAGVRSEPLSMRSLDMHETMAVSGVSGREHMNRSRSFTKMSHPDFIKIRLSNILMGSTIYSE